MKTLGIVGGIAPASTIDYYRLFIEGYRRLRPDGSYPPLVINSIDLQCFLSLVAGDRAGLIGYLLAELDRLAAAGAGVALFASNTPHLVFDDLVPSSPLPLVSIVEAAAREAERRGHRRLGLLGTRFTMEGGFYPTVFARHGLSVVTPPPDDREYVHTRYFAELANGQFRAETRAGFEAVVARMHSAHGIDGVILGGTEIPLLFREASDLAVPHLDTTAIHVAAALEAVL